MITAAAQLGDRHRAFGQHPADLVAALQVGGEVRVVVVPEPSEVHDAPEARLGGRVAERRGRLHGPWTEKSVDAPMECTR